MDSVHDKKSHDKSRDGGKRRRRVHHRRLRKFCWLHIMPEHGQQVGDGTWHKYVWWHVARLTLKTLGSE